MNLIEITEPLENFVSMPVDVNTEDKIREYISNMLTLRAADFHIPKCNYTTVGSNYLLAKKRYYKIYISWCQPPDNELAEFYFEGI
jgi:hypothetical protein